MARSILRTADLLSERDVVEGPAHPAPNPRPGQEVTRARARAVRQVGSPARDSPDPPVGADGKHANMYITEAKPGVDLGRHYHPGHTFVSVLEGTLLIQEAGKPWTEPRARRQSPFTAPGAFL
jgi:quercetin dioxygenase-like cupin family protein